MLRTGTTIAVLATSAALIACGGDDKQANNPQASQCPPGQYFDGQYCQTQQAQQQPQQQQPAPAATTAAAPPPALPVATATAGAPAQQADATTAAAATQLLGPLAQQSIMPGAKPLGPALAGNFQPGQSLEQTFQMSPGKCYTVVGAGLPTVQNLDIQIVPTAAIPGLPAAVMAADNSQGSTAVVGTKPNCFKWALPMGAPVKMIMTVTAGQGAAAAQVYEK
ncbi:MAG TPA: hypothetical protein VGP93_16920 [Polyangiaceae bacterium]|jgi:hypothetical protein|nr:hypothetical protein [Polyangiaceae bacterium]